MPQSYETLPEGYNRYLTVDLKNSKKLYVGVNAAAAGIAIVMAIIGALFVPISELFSMEEGIVAYIIRFISILVGSILYIICHELIHGLFIRIYTGRRAHYGLTGLYAFAGSDDYIMKVPYLVITLAPVAVFAVIFSAVLLFLPTEWFWVVFCLQIFNISGAAGDFYVFIKFAMLPPDILVRDTGTAMTVYTKE